MNYDTRIIDNRVFLLGLDDLFRTAIKRHEASELLDCARIVAAALSVDPVRVPIEGYYHESEKLAEYFLLMRALQKVHASREAEVAEIAAFQRLKGITSSPIFGIVGDDESLFPGAIDPLYTALSRLDTSTWDIPTITAECHAAASASNDFSLVALAALSNDPVVITATRESVVLYAMLATRAALRSEPRYEWQVDPAITERAVAFDRYRNEVIGHRL